jgi:parallel beta-helix repeat protein
MRLNEAFSQAQPGDTIRIPPGRWIVKHPLSLIDTRDVTILGTEQASVLLDDVQKPVVVLERCEGIDITGLHARHLKPLADYECHGAVIRLAECIRTSIRHCELDGSGAVGIHASSCDGLMVEGCHIHSNTFNGIYLDDCKEITIYANLIERNANAFQFHRVDDVRIAENILRDNGGYWRTVISPGASRWLPEESSRQ